MVDGLKQKRRCDRCEAIGMLHCPDVLLPEKLLAANRDGIIALITADRAATEALCEEKWRAEVEKLKQVWLPCDQTIECAVCGWIDWAENKPHPTTCPVGKLDAALTNVESERDALRAERDGLQTQLEAEQAHQVRLRADCEAIAAEARAEAVAMRSELAQARSIANDRHAAKELVIKVGGAGSGSVGNVEPS
ncbi:MAG TPA: hypothetical protein VHM25_04720, partial [Polyangiaceae bacterium]|nr:hypothetical protein [Polyangiaceae bacterium]